MIIPVAVGGKLFAAIGVTYPEGSICECTNGSKTLKAKTTSGQWVFAIPEAGTWTVTSTDGTNTKSQSVSITTEGQFETVELSYAYYLFSESDGAVVEFSTYLYSSSSGSKVTVGANKIALTGADAYGGYAVWTKTAVDVSEYSSVCFDAKFTKASATSGKTLLGISSSSNWANSLSFAASVQPDIDSTRKTYSLDISTLSGNYYIGAGSGATTGEIYNIWLE